MMETITIKNSDELEFAIFCIENIAIALNKEGSEGCADMHCMSDEYLVQELIEEYMDN